MKKVKKSKLVCYCDGDTEGGNPGRLVTRWKITGFGLNRWHNKVHREFTVTNNVSEYFALLSLLGEIRLLMAREAKLFLFLDGIEIYSDSKLMVNQVNGSFAVRAHHLEPLRDLAILTIKELGVPIKLAWLPREAINNKL